MNQLLERIRWLRSQGLLGASTPAAPPVKARRKPSTLRQAKYLPTPPVSSVIFYAAGRIGLRCFHCNGIGETFSDLAFDEGKPCQHCDFSCGFIGVDPWLPMIPQDTEALNREAKVALMAARYVAGLPLFHPEDRFGLTDEEEKAIRAEEDALSPDEDLMLDRPWSLSA